MKKYIFSLAFVLIAGHIFAQAIYITTGLGGNWNDPATWDDSFGTPDGDGDGLPDSNDDVYILNPVVVNVTANVLNLHVADISGILSKFGFGTRQINIGGFLAGDDGGGGPLAPTTNVFADLGIRLNFTGSGSIIQAWSTTSPFENLIINNGGGSFTISSPIALGGGALTLSSGTGTFSSDFINNTGTFGMSGGSIIFNGNVINEGSFNVTGGTSITFRGNVTNNNSFTVAIPTTFNGSSQIVGGTQLITFSGETTFNSAMDFNTDVTFDGDINAGSNALSFAKDFIHNNGVFNSSGTITFDGSTGQSIGGTSFTSFQNLVISNALSASNVTINGTGSSVKGTLTLAASSKFNSNGRLTLVSNASGTASVAAIPASATFTGNVIYQRYFDDKGAYWRNWGTPVAGSTTDLQANGIIVDGTDLAMYDESVAGIVDNGWIVQNTFGTSIANNRGYSQWMWAETNYPKTAQFTGPLSTVNANLLVSYNDTGDVDGDGWNLVNNPYASTIDWGDADWVKTRINGTCAVWNGSSYNYLTGAPGDLISSGQAFWVQANAGSPILRATQGVKSSSSTNFLRSEPESDWLKVVVVKGDYKDIAHIKFREDASEEFDTQYDARKLSNAIHNISSKSIGGENLAVNTVPTITDCQRTFKLDLTNASVGEYSVSFEGLASLTGGHNVKLIDNYTTTIIEVDEVTNYNFNVSEDLTSYGSERFELRFESVQLDNTIIPDFAVANECSSTLLEVNLSNLQNGVSYFLKNSNGQALTDSKVTFNGTLLFEISKTQLAAGLVHNLSIEGTTDNDCAGSLNFDNLITYEYAGIPQDPIVSGASTCIGNTAPSILSASGASNNSYYQWYTSESDVEPIADNVGDNLRIEGVEETQIYYVSIMNSEGCESSRVPVTLEVNSPEIPNLIANGNFLSVDSGIDFQWYLNGEPIEGAITNTFEVNASGEYSVLVSDGKCSSMSNARTYVITNIDDVLYKMGINVYPNPVENRLNIKSLRDGDNWKANLYDNKGNLILDKDELVLLNGINYFNTTNLQSGIYILNIEDAQGQIIPLKILKK